MPSMFVSWLSLSLPINAALFCCLRSQNWTYLVEILPFSCVFMWFGCLITEYDAGQVFSSSMLGKLGKSFRWLLGLLLLLRILRISSSNLRDPTVRGLCWNSPNTLALRRLLDDTPQELSPTSSKLRSVSRGFSFSLTQELITRSFPLIACVLICCGCTLIGLGYAWCCILVSVFWYSIVEQPIKEGALSSIPIIAFCDTDSPMRYVDIGIPANNKGKHSIGCLFWLLARMVLQMRGVIAPGHKWDIMVNKPWVFGFAITLFFCEAVPK